MALEKPGTTLVQHIRASERAHPAATGEFSALLHEIAVAAKIVSREVSRAGLLEEVLGLAGHDNVQGEEVAKLDDYANQTFVRVLAGSGHVAVLASEEAEEPIPVPPGLPRGNYAVLFDPLDGSSNIDVTLPIGTIFSVRRKRSPGPDGGLEDLVRPGSEQVAAGYVLYGSSTVLVYTAGNGVFGFTLDPTVGEFLLSHPAIRMPERGNTYSVNEGNTCYWDDGQRRLVAWLKEEDRPSGRPYSLRYVGTMVGDFHRTLLRGGIFMYPRDRKSPAGKLRYLYEGAPMAMICAQAGGLASTGTGPLLAHAPARLHERTPVYLGSRHEMAIAEAFLAGATGAPI